MPLRIPTLPRAIGQLLWAHGEPWSRGISSQDQIAQPLCSSPHKLEGRARGKTEPCGPQGGRNAQELRSSPLLGLPSSSDILQCRAVTKWPGAINAKLYTVRNITTFLGLWTPISSAQCSFFCQSEDAQVSYSTGVSETPPHGCGPSHHRVVGCQSWEGP